MLAERVGAAPNMAATRTHARLPKRTRVRAIPILTLTIREAHLTRWDRLSPLKIFAALTLLSALIHFIFVAVIWAVSAADKAPKMTYEKIEMAVLEKYTAPPLPKPKKAVKIPVLPPPPIIAAVPPPPNVEVPKPAPPPVLVTGISLSSTGKSGSFKVGVGNTLQGQMADKAAAPESVKPYKANEYAPVYLVSQLPEYLENLSAKQKNSFYPPVAKKQGLEAVVRVKIIVDDDGSVVQATALNDPGNGFAHAAERLAMALKYRPARVGGRAVATEIEWTIPFVIERD